MIYFKSKFAEMFAAEIACEEFQEEPKRIIYWNAEDVQFLRPDLTIRQCWDAICRCREVPNYETSLSWDLIGVIVEKMFPFSETNEFSRVGA